MAPNPMLSHLFTGITAASTIAIAGMFFANLGDKDLFSIVEYTPHKGTDHERGTATITIKNHKDLKWGEMIGTRGVPCRNTDDPDHPFMTHVLGTCDGNEDCKEGSDEPAVCKTCDGLKEFDGVKCPMYALGMDKTMYAAGNYDGTAIVPLAKKEDVIENDYWMHCDGVNTSSVVLKAGSKLGGANGVDTPLADINTAAKKPKGGFAVSTGLQCDGIPHCTADKDGVVKDEAGCQKFTCKNKYHGKPIEFYHNEKLSFASTSALCNTAGQYSSLLFADAGFAGGDPTSHEDVTKPWLLGGGNMGYIADTGHQGTDSYGRQGIPDHPDDGHDRIDAIHADYGVCDQVELPADNALGKKGAKFHPCCFDTAAAKKGTARFLKATYKDDDNCKAILDSVTEPTKAVDQQKFDSDEFFSAELQCNKAKQKAVQDGAEELLAYCHTDKAKRPIVVNFPSEAELTKGKCSEIGPEFKRVFGRKFLFDPTAFGAKVDDVFVTGVTKKKILDFTSDADTPEYENQYQYLDLMFQNVDALKFGTNADQRVAIANKLCETYLMKTTDDVIAASLRTPGRKALKPASNARRSRSRRATEAATTDGSKASTETKLAIWGKSQCGRDNYNVIENADEYDVVVLVGISINVFVTIIYWVFVSMGGKKDNFADGQESLITVLHVIKASILLMVGVVLAVKTSELYSLDFSNQCFMDMTDAKVGSLGAVFLSSTVLAFVSFGCLVFSGMIVGQLSGSGFGGGKWQSISTSILG